MEKLSPESTISKDKTPKEKPSDKDKPEGQKGKVIVKASPIKKMNSATQPFASTKDEMALKEISKELHKTRINQKVRSLFIEKLEVQCVQSDQWICRSILLNLSSFVSC